MTSGSSLDLVLVNPGNRGQIYQSLAADLTAIEPPVWVGLLATFVRRHGHSVKVIDANAEGLTPEETANRIVEMKPTLVAVVVYGHNPSASTQVMPAAGSLCAALKQQSPALRVLMVGGHVAALPGRTLQEEATDFVCSGEGPYTVLELLEALKAGDPDYSRVRGLGYRDGETVRFTSHAPLVQALDLEMSGVAWDLLPMKWYRAHNWHCFSHLQQREPYASLYTTLGCPYRCTYCCIQAPFKSGEQVLGLRSTVNSYRFWSPQSVITQLDTLINDYGVRNVKFADEMFVLNTRHVHSICDLIIERGYDLNIWAYARVDTIRSEATMEKLKQAGFNWLCFGIESASERVRTDVQKRFQQEEVYRTIELIRANGINVIANYLFGLPEDDLESMQQTLDLALELNCEFANFYCTMAYPGSHLYEQALRAGWTLPRTWDGYSQHAVDTLPLPTKYLSSGEILQFRDHAFQVYFNSPQYLKMITTRFGPRTAQHIKEMTSYRLKRANAQASSRDFPASSPFVGSGRDAQEPELITRRGIDRR